MFLRRKNILETVHMAESLAADKFHAPLHVSFLPAGAHVAEAVTEPVEVGHPQQGIRRSLFTADKGLDRHPHVVVHH